MVGVRHFLLMIAMVALVGCGKKEEAAEADVATEVMAAAEAKAVAFDALKVEAAKPVVVGYLPHYRGNIIDKLPVEKFTDVIFFSISPKPDGSLDTSRVKPALLAKLVGLAHAKGTRVHICIGGWNLSAGFSAMTASANARAAFVHNLINFIRKHQLQGADFDWEHPENAREMANYHRLLIEVKKVFVPDQLWLSIAVIDFAKNIKPRNLGAARDRWRAVIPFIDRFHVMAYDQGTPHAPFTGAVGALNYWEILQVPKRPSSCWAFRFMAAQRGARRLPTRKSFSVTAPSLTWIRQVVSISTDQSPFAAKPNLCYSKNTVA